jgi:methionyl aminopeptidase|tara:strand:- start:1911 stop:2795 length:885 start_codon:yes stop_codon:yes gene_type:complete
MDEQTINNYKQAGKIARDALNHGKDLIKRGTRVVDVLDKVEEKIKELGALPAFPAQISLNEVAAHYCSEEDDETTFDDQVVCLDVGVHVNGFIGDNALTVDLSNDHKDLVKASREALNAALEVVKPGAKLANIGKAIETTITDAGFQPVRNLSGHGLGEFNVHSKPTIPNFDTKENATLEENQAIAIEPFATTGVGMIEQKGDASVFELVGKKSTRIGFVRNIIKEIETYNNLPFTIRWLTKKFSANQVQYALNEMRKLGILKEHPPLVEKQQGLVAQSEHTILVLEDPIITTN